MRSQAGTDKAKPGHSARKPPNLYFMEANMSNYDASIWASLDANREDRYEAMLKRQGNAAGSFSSKRPLQHPSG